MLTLVSQSNDGMAPGLGHHCHSRVVIIACFGGEHNGGSIIAQLRGGGHAS